MKIQYREAVLKTLGEAPAPIVRAFFKQVRFLEQNLHHPSLRAKKYDEVKDIWQARVNDGWRFYFRIVDDTYQIVHVRRHPK
jgi:mRNA-degrading endonuclease RelE of RelBE toxin-antitoxin system